MRGVCVLFVCVWLPCLRVSSMLSPPFCMFHNIFTTTERFLAAKSLLLRGRSSVPSTCRSDLYRIRLSSSPVCRCRARKKGPNLARGKR